MKVLIFSWPFYPMTGGLERLTDLTATELVRLGNEVTVVTATSDPYSTAPAVPYDVQRNVGGSRLVPLVLAADVIHLNTFSIALAALAVVCGRPVVWQHIDYDTVCPLGICHRHGFPCTYSHARCWSCLRVEHTRVGSARAVLAMMVRRVAVRIVAANLISTPYAQKRMHLPRVYQVPFGIDLTKWSAPVERLLPPPLRVLFFARHIPGKGCDVLIRAISLCQARGVSISGRIAGTGPHLAASQGLAAELDLKETEFLGLISDDDLRAELQQAHVVAIPTLQDEIGQLVASEALASGAVVAVSDIGAFREQLEGVAEFFPPGDTDALSRILEALALDPHRATRRSEAGRELVYRDFDARKMGERYEAIYRQVLR